MGSFEPNLTVITPTYRTSEEQILKLAKAVRSQNYRGKVIHIFINDNVENPKKIKGLNIINNKKNIGLTSTLRRAFKNAKTEIIVSLMDDCFPASNDWLKKVVAPLAEKDVVASASKIELPKWLWDKFDFWSKALTEKEQTVLTIALDQKACAYKKSALKKVDYVDDKTFRSGGDDADLYIKLKQIGRVASADTKAYHLHDTDVKNRIKKEMQYASIAVGSIKKNFSKFPLKWKIVFPIPLIAFVLLVVSIFISWKFFLVMLGLVFLLANRRFVFQFARLWKDWRIVLLPFFNLFIYFANIYSFGRTLIFNIRP